MRFYIFFSLSIVGLLSRGTRAADGSVQGGVRGNTRNLGGREIMMMRKKPSMSKQYSGSGPVSGKVNDSSEMDDELVTGELEEEEEIVPLDTFPQWRTEKGYWIGEYTLYQGDGTPRESVSWNYPYAAYKGFITGNTQGYVQ
jgi:hypothetical protein